MVFAQALTLVIGLWACHRVAVHLAPDFNLVPNILGQDWVASHESPKVLYVLECEGHAEWQAVPAEEALISWVRDLKDRLTFHKDRQDGEDLTIPAWWVPKPVQPVLQPLKGTEHMDPQGSISLYNVVQAQLLSDAASVYLPKYLLVLYQMSMVRGGPAVEHLSVTASKSFWQTVEATAATGRFIFKANLTAPEQAIPPIQDCAILLPTILSVMYGQGEWPEESVSAQYGDHTAWDRQEILEMLAKFLSVTQAITLPDLEEYKWRSDKIALYDLFQEHYEQDPTTHFAPIPTATITLPVNSSFHREVCYSQRYFNTAVIPKSDIRATAAAILTAAVRLDSKADAMAIQQHNPDTGNTTLRKYVLKRNHSGFARKVIQITLDLGNEQQGQLLSGLLGSTPYQAHVTPASQSIELQNNDSAEACAAAAAHAMPEVPAESSLRLSVASVPHVKPVVRAPLHDAQQLLAAAERMLRESCGEVWLLQPFIPDMGSNEYRVNLIGGGQAKGTASDTAAIFTPAKAADNQLYMYNFTLPHGFFSRAPLGITDFFKSFNIDNQYNSTKEDEYKEDYFPYPIWKEAAMHQLLVDVALGGAEAFTQSSRPGRMSQNVLLRVDIALTQHGDTVRPFINEAHYYADATLMFPVWPPEVQPACSVNGTAAPQLPQTAAKPEEVTGWGTWLAQQLWQEVQWHCSQEKSNM